MNGETDTAIKAGITGLASIFAAIGVGLTSRWHSDRNTTAARANLDRMQQASADGLRSDLERARQQCVVSEQKAELWERRARRADEIAHNLRHIIAQHVQRGEIQTDMPPRVPLLEDPL